VHLIQFSFYFRYSHLSGQVKFAWFTAVIMAILLFRFSEKSNQRVQVTTNKQGHSPEEKVKGQSGAIYKGTTNVVHQILVEDL